MSRARSRYMGSSSYLGSSSSYLLGDTHSNNNYASSYALLNSPTSANNPNYFSPPTSSSLYATTHKSRYSSYGGGGRDDFLYETPPLKSSSPPPLDPYRILAGAPRLYRSARSHPELPITEITPPTPSSPPSHYNAYSKMKDFESGRSRSLEPEYGRASSSAASAYYYKEQPGSSSNDYHHTGGYPQDTPSTKPAGGYPHDKVSSSYGYYEPPPMNSPLPGNYPLTFRTPYSRISDAYRDPPNYDCSEPITLSHHRHHHHQPRQHSSRCEIGTCSGKTNNRCEGSPTRKNTSCSYNDEPSCNKRPCERNSSSPPPPPSTCNHTTQGDAPPPQGESPKRKPSSTLIRESTHHQHEKSSAPPPSKERSVVLSFEKYQSPYATINRIASMLASDGEDDLEAELLLPRILPKAASSRILRSNKAAGFREPKVKRDRRKTLAYGVSARDLLTSAMAGPAIASNAAALSRLASIPKLEHYDLALQKDAYDLLREEEQQQQQLFDAQEMTSSALRALSPDLILKGSSNLQPQHHQLHHQPSLTLASLEREVNGLKVAAAEEDEKLIVLRKDDLNSLLTSKPTLLIGKELNLSGDAAGKGSSSSSKYLHPNNAQHQAGGYHNKSGGDKETHNGGEMDYKKLWEESQLENSRLREELSRSEDTRGRLEGALDSASKPQPISEAEKREKRALEKKLSEMEEELKQIEHLKNEIQRLRDENGALIRVISKLSK